MGENWYFLERESATASFYKSFWHIIKKEVFDAIKEFFYSGVMHPNWKDTVVVLIPKTDCPDRPNHLRPISLCSTIYKIVAKILVGRFKGILPT